ncbi:MAG TPA: hypothetical protein VKE69_04125, partial [Planctomycetota bacterium]|nr:hypothetical protein [Planctomycetota bacterium]
MNRFRSLAASFLALAPAVAAQGKPDLLWLGGGHDDIRGAAITPDEQTLVTCGFSDETVKLWDVPSGMLRNTLNASIGGVTAIALSPDGTTVLSGSDVAFGSGDPLIKRWRVSDGALIQTYDTGEFHAIESLAFSSDGTRFAAAMSDHATVFDVASGAALATFTGHSFTVFSVAFSPNG